MISATPMQAIRTAVELSARYITDRKLPDRPSTSLTNRVRAQSLLSPSKRKKTIGVKMWRLLSPRSPVFRQRR